MKPKTSKPRKKLSFAVDRDEIDISTEWVNAVMGPAGAAASPPREPVFFAPKANNATGAETATEAGSSTGAENPTVEKKATDGQSATPAVVDQATVAVLAPVEESAPVEKTVEAGQSTVANFTAVEDDAPVVDIATVAPARKPRPRPIRRVTDGLTTGQYAVYSLMFEHGAGEGGAGERLYRGGYADLCALTGLSKRGIQNVVGELQQKGVIWRKQMPGHHRTETSSYAVPAPEAVVSAWLARGVRFAFGKSKTLRNTATVAV